MLAGDRALLPDDLPAGVAAFGWVPYASVLPRCAAFVHHGGAGTTAEGLRAGVPTAVVPFAHDQFDHAWRLRRLGVSITIKKRHLNQRRLTDAVRRLLEDDGLRARAAALGAEVAGEEDGAIVAAREVHKRLA